MVQAIEFNPKLRKRRKKYLDWLYGAAIEPRLVATPKLPELLINYIKEFLNSSLNRRLDGH